MKIEDKSIVYQSVSLFDRFYSKNKEIIFTFKDGLLTGFTSLFIASKSQEVEPISLSDIKNHFMNKNVFLDTVERLKHNKRCL